MLAPNVDVWETRLQSVEALLTASAGGRDEVYYLATVCQVGLDPPLVSISPNPEYPICDAVAEAGYFGVNFLRETQGELISRCTALELTRPDKVSALGVSYRRTENGTILLTDCVRAFECRVEKAWDSGDHRTVIGRVVSETTPLARGELTPHRFGGSEPRWRRLLKGLACRSGAYDLLTAIRARGREVVDIEEGTRRRLVPPTSGAPTPSPGPVASSAGESKRTESKPGIGLIGCGWWGAVHALHLKSLGDRVERYFVSRSRARALEFADRFGGTALDGYEEALTDPRVDAVILALPHHLHAEAAHAALRAGKHVLVEKPLATDLDDAKSLVRLAESSGLCLAVAEQYRLSPLVKRAGELIHAGRLGRVTLVTAGSAGNYRPPEGWKTSRKRSGGGVLLDVGIHYVSILRSWFGDPELVWAVAPRRLQEDLEGEDAIATTLQFSAGQVAQVLVSWSGYRSPEVPNLEVVGDRANLRLWFRKPHLVVSEPLPDRHWSNRLRALLPWRVGQRLSGLLRRLPNSRSDRVRVDDEDLIGSRALVEDFVGAIATGRPPAVSGTEGLEDLRVVLSGYEALRTGRPVRLEGTVPGDAPRGAEPAAEQGPDG